MTDIPNFISDLIASISDNFKKIISVVGIFYCLGFIIHRGYLLGYGINEFEFLQTKYISTGLLFSINVTFVLLPYIIKIIQHISLKNKENSRKKKDNGSEPRYIAIVNIILLFSFIIFVVLYVSVYLKLKTTQDKYNIISIIFIIIFIIFSGLELYSHQDGSNQIIYNNLKENRRKILELTVQLFISICISHVFLYLSLASNIDFNLSDLLNPFNSKAIQYINGYYIFLFEIIGWYIALLIIGISLFFLVIKSKDTEKTQILFVSTKYWLIVIVTIFSLFTIQKYAREIYPKIATNLGGGNPSIVELVLKNDKFDSQFFDDRFKLWNKGYGSEADDSENPKKLLLLYPVKLIAENSIYYYIAPLTKEQYGNEIKENCINNVCEQFNKDRNYKILQISKDDVSSIIYVEDNN